MRSTRRLYYGQMQFKDFDTIKIQHYDNRLYKSLFVDNTFRKLQSPNPQRSYGCVEDSAQVVSLVA